MTNSPMLQLLDQGNWGRFQPNFDRLQQWDLYPMLLETFKNLKQDVLFVSEMHGLGHIERTILQGGFCAMEEHISPIDTQLLLECCSYHDVGRLDDSLDPYHGHRSAQRLPELTGRQGEELKLMQTAVDVHSRHDSDFEQILPLYAPSDHKRAAHLTQLLKDSDGLDRVRLGDLNPRYLRCDSSRQRVSLAKEVFERYQQAIGRSPEPFFNKKIRTMMQQHYDNEGSRS